MKALKIDKPRKICRKFPQLGHIEYVDIPTPKPKPNEVLISVRYCCICGTDFDVCRFNSKQKSLFGGNVTYPNILGHEMSGVIVELGAFVTNFKIGDLVAVESLIACGFCEYCLLGKRNQCSNVELLGLTKSGTFAEYVVVPSITCHSLLPLIKHNYSLDEALIIGALLEPFGCAYNGIINEMGGVNPGNNVVIFGLGPIGIYSGILSIVSGAVNVIGLDKNSERREWAINNNFSYCLKQFNLSNIVKLSDNIVSLLEGNKADIIIDASGNPKDVFPFIEKIGSPCSKVLVLSRSVLPVTFDTNSIVTNAIHIYGSRGHSGGMNYKMLIRIFAGRKINIKNLYGLVQDFNSLKELLSDENSRTLKKIVIKMGKE